MLITVLSGLIYQYKYIILIPAALIGGPIISLFSGSLVRLGYLHIVPTYLALMAGELIGDIVWYWIGYELGEGFAKKYGKYVGIKVTHLRLVKKLFKEFPSTILFFSKVTMGLGFAIVTLFTAGLARVPFRRYLVVNLVGQVIWSGILLSLGYLLGYTFLQNADTRIVLLIMYAAVLIILLIFEKTLRRWLMRRYQEE